MKKLITILSLVVFGMTLSAQNRVPAYAETANKVSQQNILTTLTEFQNLGVKSTGSVAQANTLTWLKGKYADFGYDAAVMVEDPFLIGNKTSKNLIVTKTGTKYPNTFVIICGHYDTINGPGVNDNGSGTSVILEVARLLKDIPTEYSIKFIHFAGEELGLYGSEHYVANVVNGTSPKMDIKLVFNIDEVGGVKGKVNNVIACDRDESPPMHNNAASAQVTQELMSYVGFYSPLQTKASKAYASDYMPFQANGEVITGFYEANESPYPHTANDVLSNMDPVYVYNIAKAATGAMQHFAAADACAMATAETHKKTPQLLYDKQSRTLKVLSDSSDYHLTLTDSVGRKVLESNGGAERIDARNLASGVYFVQIDTGNESYRSKVIVN
ncbi:MAG: M28 family peptidase [Chryseobacterium sp.]|nr:MAG: M28 family peptidase [Chryseobacterium sp.]